MTTTDLRDYVVAQARFEVTFKSVEPWIRMSILNTAASARFSIDRTIGDYNNDIRKFEPFPPVQP